MDGIGADFQFLRGFVFGPECTTDDIACLGRQIRPAASGFLFGCRNGETIGFGCAFAGVADGASGRDDRGVDAFGELPIGFGEALVHLGLVDSPLALRTDATVIGAVGPCLLDPDFRIGLVFANVFDELSGVRRIGFGFPAEMAGLLDGDNVLLPIFEKVVDGAAGIDLSHALGGIGPGVDGVLLGIRIFFALHDIVPMPLERTSADIGAGENDLMSGDGLGDIRQIFSDADGEAVADHKNTKGYDVADHMKS